MVNSSDNNTKTIKGIPAEDIDVDLMRKLYLENKELFQQIELPLITKKYTQTLPSDIIARVACDQKFQQKLLALNEDEYNLFIKCLKTAQSHGANLVTAADKLVTGIKNPQFSELIADCIQNGSPNTETLNILLNQEENYFGIKTVTQMNNYPAIKKLLCNKILQNPEDETSLTEPLMRISPEDRVKFAQTEKEFGISLSQAKLLCQKYGHGILVSDEIICNNEVHSCLQKLTDIIEAPTNEAVLTVKNTSENRQQPLTFDEIDTSMRRQFADSYNKAFYQPNDQDKIAIETYNGKTVDIYDAGVEFTMCTHVVGAYSDSDERVNTQERWNPSVRQSHVFCTRLIANEALEVAKEGALCYGFTNFDKDALIASAPWDMASIKNNLTFNTVGDMDAQKIMQAHEGSGARFLTPTEQINHTRTDESETNWDRFNSDGSRKQPSYIVFIAGSLKDTEYKNTPLYQQSIQAAAQFNIPIVLIDREKVIANEHQAINQLIEEYKKTHNPKTLNRLISRFENNRTTCYNKHTAGIYQKQFPLLKTDKSGDFKSLQEIIEQISDNNPQHTQHLVDALSAQAVLSLNQHSEFCKLIYDIKDKCPDVKVDINSHLKKHLGITQKPCNPAKISQYYMSSFYAKAEAEKNPTVQNKTQNTDNSYTE
ncbi:MAG: hypothetical protein VZR95_07590 [Alphaproteobacteria bacterium]